jgi:hypothetical protein
MTYYLHFRCIPPCKRVYALQRDGERNLKDMTKVACPHCRACGKKTRSSGTGANKPRGGAIVLTQTSLARLARPRRTAFREQANKLVAQQDQEQMLDIEVGMVDDPDEDEQEDVNYVGESHTYNIRMRLTPGPYQARPTGGIVDSNAVLTMINRPITGTAGRGNLNDIMGKYLSPVTVLTKDYSAWRHVGGPPYNQKTKFRSFEWCHLVADSLGGESIPKNLVAASFCANTFMAALEAMLKAQSALSLSVTVECTSPHAADFIKYVITHPAKQKSITFDIDALAMGFSALDLTKYQTELQQWLKIVGINAALSA